MNKIDFQGLGCSLGYLIIGSLPKISSHSSYTNIRERKKGVMGETGIIWIP